jgi:hypothetical protein
MAAEISAEANVRPEAATAGETGAAAAVLRDRFRASAEKKSGKDN